MGNIPQSQIHKFLRHDKKFPHVWCSGCSNGIILGATIRAISELGYAKDDVAMVSGIGCSSRMPVYVDFNTLHSLHGRAIAYATGVKFYKPEMKVVVITGDGDATAIGGNHFIHGARRNIDITVILINNNIYGMTGGQHSPTTPFGDRATTMPYGNIDPSFDICKLAIGAGATFVARTSAFHAHEVKTTIIKAFKHKGFSLVEVMSTCPVIYGRLNKKGGPAQMLELLKENIIPEKKYNALNEEEKIGKLPRGIFVEELKPEYTEVYNDLVNSLQKSKGDKV
ncbi:2-oxoacid:ferredoxin oxidoreductase subunit beta [Candidatus Cloacimonadota bacterium]